MDAAADFTGFAEPAQRGFGDDPAAAVGIAAVVVEQQRPVLVADEKPRRNRVDPDGGTELGGQFDCQRAGQIVDRRFGVAVAEYLT